jgi:hypothetical protein
LIGDGILSSLIPISAFKVDRNNKKTVKGYKSDSMNWFGEKKINKDEMEVTLRRFHCKVLSNV